LSDSKNDADLAPLPEQEYDVAQVFEQFEGQ
jgi:hypothetical protein